jgi:P-type Mg2+ transporter
LDAAHLTNAARQPRKRRRHSSIGWLLWAQLKSPLVLLLLGASGVSMLVGETTDAAVILAIVLIGSGLGLSQEHAANEAVEKLLALVKTKARVVREGLELEVMAEEVVVGDLVLLDAGALVPGDCVIEESRDLHLDEATLTGETLAVEKEAGPDDTNAPLAERAHALFQGTHVVSGTARARVLAVGDDTEFGKISARLDTAPAPTEFERGIDRFGVMIAKVTAALTVLILFANLALHRPLLESLLYSLALAVGLVPELLPAITSVNLSLGAKRMAQAQVIVKRLASIEDFGSMDVLCTDKTGTLTEGKARIEGTVNAYGVADDRVLRLAAINAAFETGLANPIDTALREAGVDLDGVDKLDEAPYDFVRKRMSVLVEEAGVVKLITKGAVANVLDVCTTALDVDGVARPIADLRATIDATFHALSEQGLRCLGVAERVLENTRVANAAAERELVFRGFLALFDPPKPGTSETLATLAGLGVKLKMITGDNREVAGAVARQVGIENPNILTGRELRETSDQALARRCETVDVFAEIEPNQKERIIVALRKAGHVVGYLGDGINDAPALHAAHVGVSVDTAADVAKEAAQIVLMRHDLAVLIEGVKLGRATFENTLKYIRITASANFGNMVSMAVAGVFLPFLPLLPKQILLNNLLSDLPAITIAGDRVDDEHIAKARRWDAAAIGRFMVVFGVISSLFDLLTFGALWLLSARDAEFQTAWFVESLLTEIAILLVMRTRRPFWKSKPSVALMLSVVGVGVVALALPYLPGPFGFVALRLQLVAVLLTITAAYLVVSEFAKRRFFERA